MKNKKAQMDVVSNIITLIIGVGVSVMVLIFIGSLGGQTYNLVESDINAIGNNQVSLESITPTIQTPAALSHHSIQTGTLVLYNATNRIGLGNFTIDYDQGTVKSYTSLINNTAIYANYTWGSSEIRSSVQNSVVSGFGALEQTGNYLPIIVLAVVISLVLFLILGFTALGGRGGGSVL